MANYDTIISKAQDIITKANNAKALSEIANDIDTEASITPLTTSGKKIDFSFDNSSAEMETILTAEKNTLGSQINTLETDMDNLADDIITELE